MPLPAPHSSPWSMDEEAQESFADSPSSCHVWQEPPPPPPPPSAPPARPLAMCSRKRYEPDQREQSDGAIPSPISKGYQVPETIQLFPNVSKGFQQQASSAENCTILFASAFLSIAITYRMPVPVFRPTPPEGVLVPSRPHCQVFLASAPGHGGANFCCRCVLDLQMVNVEWHACAPFK